MIDYIARTKPDKLIKLRTSCTGDAGDVYTHNVLPHLRGRGCDFRAKGKTT